MIEIEEIGNLRNISVSPRAIGKVAHFLSLIVLEELREMLLWFFLSEINGAPYGV